MENLDKSSDISFFPVQISYQDNQYESSEFA